MSKPPPPHVTPPWLSATRAKLATLHGDLRAADARLVQAQEQAPVLGLARLALHGADALAARWDRGLGLVDAVLDERSWSWAWEPRKDGRK